MTDSISIYEKYNIDLNRLSRDYLKFPLKRQYHIKGHPSEIPPKEDIEYLYFEKLVNIKYISIFMHISETTLHKIMLMYNIESSKYHVNKVKKQTNIIEYGVSDPNKLDCKKEKSKQTRLEKYGSYFSEKTTEKRKQTCLEKYGETTPLKSDKIKEKIKQTCLERYGTEYATQSNTVKEKTKHTNLERYGVICTLQSEQSIKKKTNTWLNHYGVDHPRKSKEVKEKIKQTNIKLYGVEYASQNNKIIEKQKQTCLKRYGKIGYNNREKYKETCLERFGVDNPFKSKEIMKNIIGKTSSKHEKLWLKQLNINLVQKEFYCGNNTYFVDGFDPKTNTVYEFLGDFYHGNPKIFNLKDINPRLNVMYEDLYKYTFKRFDNLKNTYDVNIIYIWDSDFMKNDRIREDWKDKMIEY